MEVLVEIDETVIGKQEGAPKQTYRGYGQQFRDNGSKYLHVAAPTYPTSRDVTGSVCELTTPSC